MSAKEGEGQKPDRSRAAADEETPSERGTSPAPQARSAEARPDPDPDIYRRGGWRQPRKPVGEWLRLASAGAVAIAVGLGLLSAVQTLWHVLAVIFLGITIAAALNPIVSWLERGRLPRALAVVGIYLVLLGIIVIIGFLIVPGLLTQGQRLIDSAPDALEAVEWWLNRQTWLLRMLRVDEVTEIEWLEAFTEGATAFGTTLIGVPGAIVTVIAEFLLMIFISIYGLVLAHDISDYLRSLFPSEEEGVVLAALHQILSAMGGYLRGLLIDASILGTVTYIGLLLIGVNFPLLLGVLAGMGEIVPIAGPAIAGSLIVLVALFQSFQRALIALAFVLVLQQFEANILVPIIMKSQVHISPLFTLIAIAIGGTLGGLLGAIVAVPVAAALTALTRVAIAPAIRRATGAPPRRE
jgi:putative heme transporter